MHTAASGLPYAGPCPPNHAAEPNFLLQNGQDTRLLFSGEMRRLALQFGQIAVTRLTFDAGDGDPDLSVHFIDCVCDSAVSVSG